MWRGISVSRAIYTRVHTRIYILTHTHTHTQHTKKTPPPPPHLTQSTAELVHIDLGVCFDLGKMLRTPEIVPFRLVVRGSGG